MSGVKYFETRTQAEVRLREVLADWPAATVVVEFRVGKERAMFKIAGDYACTKFLHEDGHVY
jgi:hypothetical protein